MLIAKHADSYRFLLTFLRVRTCTYPYPGPNEGRCSRPRLKLLGEIISELQLVLVWRGETEWIERGLIRGRMDSAFPRGKGGRREHGGMSSRPNS